MLQILYTAARRVVAERQGSSAFYCGWGTLVDELAREAFEMGVPLSSINKVLRLAHHNGDLYQAHLKPKAAVSYSQRQRRKP